MVNNMFTNILGYNVFNGTKEQFMDYIDKFNKINIISGNPEVLYNGFSDSKLYNYFTSKYSIIIPDGVGTLIASKILKNPIHEKIAGIDIMDEIIKRCELENKSIYLLGAKQLVLENCIKNLKRKYNRLEVAGSHNGYFDFKNCEYIIKEIITKKPYAIFVAMGSPRQDIFISQNIDKLPCSIFMGVGGSFDVLSGQIKRAPKWMIKFGLEWLYRISREPQRISRMNSILKFLLKVIRCKNR